MKLKIVILTLIFSASIILPAFPEDFRPEERDYNIFIFSPFAGGYFFESGQRFGIDNPNYDLSNTYSLGMRIGYGINRYFDVEGTLNFVPASHNVGDVHIYLYHADLVYNIVNYGRFTPYVDFGAGAATFSPVLGASATDPLITYAVGLKIFIFENLAFRIEGRGYTKFNETFTNLNLTGSLTYFTGFRTNRDSDHDGYPDNYDLCPYEPENFDGYLDDDGCPDNKGNDPLKGFCEEKK